MAIVLGIEYFKAYLYGCKFTVRTDHRPLAWLRDHAKPSGRLARWLIKVREFDISQFISGVQNNVADALSRYFLEDNREEEECVDDDPGIVINSIAFAPHELNTQQAADPDIKQLFRWVTKQEEVPIAPPENASSELKKFHRSWTKCIRGHVYKERTKTDHGRFRRFRQPRTRTTDTSL